MPITLTKKEYARLLAATDKNRNSSCKPKASQSKPKARYLYLRYTKDGGVRARRLVVRDKGLGTHCCEVVGHHKMSRVLKAVSRHALILELDRPEHLEVLIQQAFEYLGADPNSGRWYWDNGVEDL